MTSDTDIAIKKCNSKNLLDKKVICIKIKNILLGIKYNLKGAPPCGLKDSGFVRYPTVKRVAIVSPPPIGDGRSRKSPSVERQRVFFVIESIICYDVARCIYD